MTQLNITWSVLAGRRAGTRRRLLVGPDLKPRVHLRTSCNSIWLIFHTNPWKGCKSAQNNVMFFFTHSTYDIRSSTGRPCGRLWRGSVHFHWFFSCVCVCMSVFCANPGKRSEMDTSALLLKLDLPLQLESLPLSEAPCTHTHI